MKRARFSEEQIIGILKAAEAVGNIREPWRENNISEQTFYRWRRKFAGMEAPEAKKLRELDEARVRFPRPPDVTVSPHGTSWHLMALRDRTKLSE